MLTWKYTLPAFLVPFVFTLSPEGLGVLMQAPLGDIVSASLTAAVGVARAGRRVRRLDSRPRLLPERLGAGRRGAPPVLCSRRWTDAGRNRNHGRGADLALQPATAT